MDNKMNAPKIIAETGRTMKIVEDFYDGRQK